MYEQLVAAGLVVPQPEKEPPSVPMDYSWAQELGLIRKPSSFMSSICDERGSGAAVRWHAHFRCLQGAVLSLVRSCFILVVYNTYTRCVYVALFPDPLLAYSTFEPSKEKLFAQFKGQVCV